MIRMPHLHAACSGTSKTSCRRPATAGASSRRQRRRRTYYVYDAAGQRVRKVTGERQTGPHARRAHLPRRLRDLPQARRQWRNTLTLERETLHVMDDKQRIALVETRTLEHGSSMHRTDPCPLPVGNHLGSASLELDVQDGIISYEEYTPTAARRIRRCAAQR